MSIYVLDDKPKQMRETLAIAQSSLVLNTSLNLSELHTHLQRLDRFIYLIDQMRPLGPDGKHGNRHTEVCGCEQ